MNDPQSDPADLALLDQVIRASRDDGPDDERLHRLERRVAPLVMAKAPGQWWHARNLSLVGGAAVVVASAFVGQRVLSNTTASPDVGSEQRSASPIASPAIPTGAVDEARAAAVNEAPPPIPVVSIDSVPAAPRPQPKSGSDTRAKRAPDPPAAVEPAHAPDQAAPADELALLEKARRTLATDPARTLAITDVHAKLFARPSFAQERERLAIDALVRQGRMAEAQQRAALFETTYPDSPHLTRVQGLVAPRKAPSTAEGGQ